MTQMKCLFRSSLRCSVLMGILIQSVTSPAWAHGSRDEASLAATMALYREIADLAPDIYETPSHSEASLQISGQTIYLNSAFWQLVRGWIRIYYRELQNQCDGCVKWSEDQFLEAAQDQIAQSFFSLKVGQPLTEAIEHIATGSADVGARLGKTALVAKLTGEVAETVLSKMVFMGGLHFFCHLIDGLIIFSTRYIQTGTRLVGWSSLFSNSAAENLVRSSFIASVLYRAQNRVHFVSEPLEINSTQIGLVDGEGPNRYWGRVPEGKRSLWIKKMALHSESVLAKKEFMGQRMKRYFWLKSRRRGNSSFLAGTRGVDKALNQNILWILQVQESLVQRALIPLGQETRIAKQALLAEKAVGTDEIRQGLATEFSKGEPVRSEFVANLLKDVEMIFDPNVSREVRYFQAVALENLLAGFMYGQFGAVLEEQGELHGNSAVGIWRQMRLRWRAGSFGNYIYEWSDFLRLASLQDNSEKLLQYKYESMESLLRILKYFQATKTLVVDDSLAALNLSEENLSNENKALQTFKPWRQKRIYRSWWPLSKASPTCKAMALAVSR